MSHWDDPGWKEAAREYAANREREPKPKPKRPERPIPPISYDSFYAYLPQHTYIYLPTGALWPAASVNACLPSVEIPMADGKTARIKPSTWLDQNKPVEQMTWAPGEPTLIKHKLVAAGGFIHHEGATIYNHYVPPDIVPGDADNAEPWVEHVRKIYPEEADHLIAWCAHRRQYPHVKINHAIVLGGAPGIGKDTLLEPVLRAVGYWNTRAITPQQLLGRFNGFLKSVILYVSEARDLGEINRPQFYEHTKLIIASPPETLLIDEKNTHEYSIPNLTGIVITTNHKAAGIYLPADDRRHYVAWSPRNEEDFPPGYWTRIYAWYEAGGYEDVAAYLQTYDLSGFDPKAPPPRTKGFLEIVAASRAAEDAEMQTCLDLLGDPDVVTLDELIRVATEDFATWLKDRRNSRTVGRRLEACGFVPCSNPDNKAGYWRIEGQRKVIYGKDTLSVREQIEAVYRKWRQR